MKITPVQVSAHLLAWPHDFGNLSNARMSSSSFLVGNNLAKLFFCDCHFWELLQPYNCGLTVNFYVNCCITVYRLVVKWLRHLLTYQKQGKCGHFMLQFGYSLYSVVEPCKEQEFCDEGDHAQHFPFRGPPIDLILGRTL